MATATIQKLDGVLASIDARFDDEACAVFGSSVFAVMDDIRDVPDTDKSKHSETCRELFKVGRGAWLESLVKLVHGYAEQVVQVAMSCPVPSTEEAAHWVTLQLTVLLSKHLRQELSMEVLAQQATQRTLARVGNVSGFTHPLVVEIARLNFTRSNSSASEPIPTDNKSDQSRRYSKVGTWFRWVADNGPDFDRSESGFHEPWTAPAFCDDGGFFAKRREQATVGGSDRLTEERTARIIRRAEIIFAGRFDYVLRQVEHNARITIGTNGKVPFPVVDKAPTFSAPAARGSQEVHDTSGSANRPDGTAPNGKDRASKRRAKLVAKVTKELLVLKAEPYFELPEDFDTVEAKFRRRGYYVFSAASQFPAVKGLLLTAKNTRNAKPIGLAQEIVSIAETVSTHTVFEDWKKYKPKEFRSR